MKLIIKNLSKERQFGVLFSFIFSILLIYIFLKYNLFEIKVFIINLFLIMFTLFFPKIFYYPNKIWIKFGILLGKLTTPIFLFVLYSIFFVPIGIIYKILSNDPLKRALNGSSKTYWEPRCNKIQSMKRQF